MAQTYQGKARPETKNEEIFALAFLVKIRPTPIDPP
jgi:hypothetical protein